ncbi:MAG: hypothetical protein LQ341_006907 [Variospora aurantia]|nr:MAG: hypothetical protein LQ341_006907 [Variospora aurantia]
MAQSICIRLQKHRVPFRAGQSDLDDQFEKLLRRFHHHRGELSLHTNQPKLSLSSYSTFIQMLREQIGDQPRGTDQSLGVALNELGCAHLQNANCSEAEDCFKKSLIRLVLSTAQQISTSMPLINLAFAYWLQGHFPKASSTFQQALEDREETYGVNDKTSFV